MDLFWMVIYVWLSRLRCFMRCLNVGGLILMWCWSFVCLRRCCWSDLRGVVVLMILMMLFLIG